MNQPGISPAGFFCGSVSALTRLGIGALANCRHILQVQVLRFWHLMLPLR